MKLVLKNSDFTSGRSTSIDFPYGNLNDLNFDKLKLKDGDNIVIDLIDESYDDILLLLELPTAVSNMVSTKEDALDYIQQLIYDATHC